LSTGYLYGALNVIADWTFVLIPICVLIDSDLDRRAKISVSIVMGLGAVGSISSIMRMVYLEGILFSEKGLTSKHTTLHYPGSGLTEQQAKPSKQPSGRPQNQAAASLPPPLPFSGPSSATLPPRCVLVRRLTGPMAHALARPMLPRKTTASLSHIEVERAVRIALAATSHGAPQ
jgi:hypothetical protein